MSDVLLFYYSAEACSLVIWSGAVRLPLGRRQRKVPENPPIRLPPRVCQRRSCQVRK